LNEAENYVFFSEDERDAKEDPSTLRNLAHTFAVVAGLHFARGVTAAAKGKTKIPQTKPQTEPPKPSSGREKEEFRKKSHRTLTKTPVPVEATAQKGLETERAVVLKKFQQKARETIAQKRAQDFQNWGFTPEHI